MKSERYLLRALIAFVTVFHCAQVGADGTTIDKIYHPYVEQLEWELEWRATHANQNPTSGQEREQRHRLGLGRAVSEFVFIEGYLIGERSADDDLNLEAYEIEALWQLSEQGEFAVDYGLLFELEREHSNDVWEYGTTLLVEKELGRYSATANFGLIYEWGDDIKDEWETALALQWRYRHSPRLEPALEFYAGEETLGGGPVVAGLEKIGPMRALKWEIGLIFGLDNDTADYTLRTVLEYEF